MKSCIKISKNLALNVITVVTVGAVCLYLSPAYASKARLLGAGENGGGESHSEGAFILTPDYRNVFWAPSAMLKMSDQVVFEMGNVAGAVKPEGGFFTALDSGDKMGFHLGNSNAETIAYRANSVTGLLLPENTWEIFYAMKDLRWGLSFWSSMSKKESTRQSQDDFGLRTDGSFGSNWGWSLVLGLASRAKNEVAYEVPVGGASPPVLRGEYKAGVSSRFSVTYKWDLDSRIMVSAQNSSFRFADFENVISDKANRFYGLKYGRSIKLAGGVLGFTAGIQQTTSDDRVAKTKIISNNLPVSILLENEVASWLILRGGVRQSILIASSSTITPTTTTTDFSGADTVVSAGAGLKFNNVVVDGVLGAASGGVLDGVNTFTQTSMTFVF